MGARIVRRLRDSGGTIHSFKLPFVIEICILDEFIAHCLKTV